MKYVYVLLAGVAIAILIFWGGWHFKGTQDAAAIAKASQKNTIVTTRVVTKYVQSQAKIQTVYKTLIKKVPYVEKVYVQGKPVSAPIILDSQFVGLWNDSLLSSTAPTIATASTPTNITLADALSNHVQNASICASTTAQLNALLDWGKQTQGWKVE